MQTEILSDEELAELTGYKARGYQRRWLEERGWVFVETRSGRPLVGRHYVRMKLGMSLGVMPTASPPPVVPAWTPDISKVR
ncbi:MULTISPECIES: DUF4224 domain-containing protein [Pseudomonas]|jgi:hypothetical protein|uniref:DUF4224 domain-containing protein n=1 Tax=Pseudomonas TaxID=286 RepID=UPI000B58B404|nr:MULTISPECIES: DUF4224 domain-containing protein [Pseudomonas]AUY32667.1 DUF4224 domain-containing protein [Pseudomonas sp. PONIH3]MDH0630837.1 DUF4224 domain-containing protein [Pseudomonas mosselii]MDH0679916.1 DUF4224 domain-containing protein [Pseudomonas mosselii]MDH0928038.1 DUF4224 domain-containing protein [Pseudomonas mosselii]MDH1137732.1 DUF4224 domain-containing protein [Pseudomonas mosselii]